MGLLSLFIFLCASLTCTSQVNSFSLTECNDQGNFDIAESQLRPLTCTGLQSWHNIYWSVTGPATGGVETRIGSCRQCNALCNNGCATYCVTCNPACLKPCSTFDDDYRITRGINSTTLHFQQNVNKNDGRTVKCSNYGDTTNAECKINVIKAYKLQNCFNNQLQLVQGRNTNIRCTGLHPTQSMYWAITDRTGAWGVIAECDFCSGGFCPACRVNSYFSVTRRGHYSDLQILGNEDRVNGWLVKCSKRDGATYDQCNIRVKSPHEYNLPQCHGETLLLSEIRPQLTVQCNGLERLQNMNWTFTDASGPTVQIASCFVVRGGYDCTVGDTDFSATRSEYVGLLSIDNYVREKYANKTLTCIRQDGNRWGSCRIRIVYPAETREPQVTLNGWLLLGRVVISKVFDSDNDVSCAWNLTGPSVHILTYLRANLTAIPEEDGRQYYGGSCELSVPLNATEGVYHLVLSVWPGGDPLSVGSVTVAEPGELFLEPATCPDVVTEGSSVECQCQHEANQQGSPAASVTWLSADTSSVLKISNVSQSQNGTVFTCRSVWGPNAEVVQEQNYTLLVTESQQAQKGIQTAAVAGAAVGVVVIIVIIIAVVVIVKRKRSSKTPTAEQEEEFQEYINEYYDSSDQIDSSNINAHNATHPLTTSQANASGHPANPEGASVYMNTAPAIANPSGDVYAEVVKNGKGKTQDSNQSTQPQNNSNETYAQVQKKPKGENPSGKGEPSAQKKNEEGETSAGQDAKQAGKQDSAQGTVYANCPEESTGGKAGAVYMNMASGENKDGTRVSTTDDEYNRLGFAKRDAQEPTSVYDHLGDL